MEKMPEEVGTMQIGYLDTAAVPIIREHGNIYYDISPQDIQNLLSTNKRLYESATYVLKQVNGLVRISFRGPDNLSPREVVPQMHMDPFQATEFPHVIATCNIDARDFVGGVSTTHGGDDNYISIMVTSANSLVTYLKWLCSRTSARVPPALAEDEYGVPVFESRVTMRLRLHGQATKHKKIVDAACAARNILSAVTILDDGIHEEIGPLQEGSMDTICAAFASRLSRAVAVGMADTKSAHLYDQIPRDFVSLTIDIGQYLEEHKAAIAESEGMGQQLKSLLIAAALNWTRVFTAEHLDPGVDEDMAFLQLMRYHSSKWCGKDHCMCAVVMAAGFDPDTPATSFKSGFPPMLWIQIQHIRLLKHPRLLRRGMVDLCQLAVELENLLAQLKSLDKSAMEHTTYFHCYAAIDHDICMVAKARETGGLVLESGVPLIRLASPNEIFLKKSSMHCRRMLLTDVWGNVHAGARCENRQFDWIPCKSDMLCHSCSWKPSESHFMLK